MSSILSKVCIAQQLIQHENKVVEIVLLSSDIMDFKILFSERLYWMSCDLDLANDSTCCCEIVPAK